MPKIETPGMFRERIAENFIVGETGHLAFQEGGKERIDSMIEEHDAAIRAESAELLRVCGEALTSANKQTQGVNAKVRTALTALNGAGVME